VAALLIVVAAGGIYAYAKYIESTMQRTVVRQEKLSVDLAKAKPQEPYNVLIMGVDKRSGDTMYRSDSLMLARIDPKTKQVWMVSIPRDMRAQIPGHGYAKINSAYALGTEQLAIDSVEKLTGVAINHFMAIDFSGFEKVVDAMGGVWIDVPVEINDKQADRSKGDKASHIDAGYQLLDGAHSLTFVRARHQFADQDFSRMKNQQLFAKAIADQVAKKTSVARVPRIVAAVAPNISTDMSLMEMMRTAQALKAAGSENVYTTTLPGTWRTPFIWPDEAAMQKIIAKLEAGEPFEPKPKKATESSETVSPAATEGAQAPAKKPSQITVTVRNGAGIVGCAKQAASILKARAFKVEDVGNTNQFVYKQTLVIYKSDKASAELIQGSLPPGTKLVQSRGMYAFDTAVLVVVGKDWDVSRVPVAPIQTQ
jgi:LCP family protein required for cell wall assembly